VSETRAGLQTGDNNLFLRYWQEVDFDHMGLGMRSRVEAKQSRKRWFPHNKGGAYRKWYGNGEYVVDWGNDGENIKRKKAEDVASGRITANNSKCWNQEVYFLRGLSWSSLTQGDISLRDNGFGYLFDTKGQTLFANDEADYAPILGLLNSCVAADLLACLAPTMDFNGGTVTKLPFTTSEASSDRVAYLVNEAISIARSDWNNFETSWDFRDQPLLRPGLTGLALEASWRDWEVQSTAAIRRMQELETENNRLFIAAYGLEGELQPEVPEAQITLARADQRKDIAAFLSYATGCMMGRYSLDHPGLILADSRDSQAAQLAAYEDKVGKPLSEVQFKPDPDGIIPVLDGEWFEDDIVARTREFLAVTFPESNVAENLRFIEESLGKDIRKYICSEFYKDHLQTYKKRPIYWMVQSPKKGFACLIYLHRYTKDTLNQVLNNYFRPYLQKLEARLAQLGLDQLNDSLSTRERTAARKEAEKITKVLKECQAWEQDALLPLAQQRIPLDLDDGVKVNYLKLQDVLAPIPGLAAKED
jgi:hypothetical protein